MYYIYLATDSKLKKKIFLMIKDKVWTAYKSPENSI